MRAPYHVLFLCTGNSARSILAESILRDKAGGRFVAHSAGSRPAGRVHPRVLSWLRRRGLPIEGLRSKNWDEFARPDAPPLDLVITVCDNAHEELNRRHEGTHAGRLHWSVPDPVPVGTRKAFDTAYDDLAMRVSHVAPRLAAS